MRNLRVTLFGFVVATTCCGWPENAVIVSGGKRLCAKHHIPLVTVPGYTYDSDAAVLIHHLPEDEFNKIAAQTPNRIDDSYSLHPSRDQSKRISVTYCSLCQKEFEDCWLGRPINRTSLIGTWRGADGFVRTFERDGTYFGVSTSGKKFTGSWTIPHHGMLLITLKGVSEPEPCVITSIVGDRLTIRFEDGLENWTRLR